MLTSFEMESRVVEAKARVSSIAKTSSNFADFEYDVLHDKIITALVPRRIVKILIQSHAANLE